MKKIDLLNKIANGEEVPKKIKIGNKIYNYETFNIGKGDNYFTAEWEEVKGYRINYDGTYYYLEIRDYNLNDEVEIIEEEKKDNFTGWKIYQDGKEVCSMDYSVEEKKIPEKIDKRGFLDNETLDQVDADLYFIIDKINEIIDYLDYFKSKGDE